MKNGYGNFIFENKNIFKGIFENDLFKNGIFYFYDGSRYEGEFSNNKINGKGKYYFKNGNKYEGEFKDNKIKGKGKYSFKENIIHKEDLIDI